MGRVLRKLKTLRFLPFDRGDRSADGERRVDNDDASAMPAGSHAFAPPGYVNAPPGYVKDDDDGRPRH